MLTPERQRFYRHRKALAVHAYLMDHPCVDCGEADPVVLDFDHVRGIKRSGVKRMLAGTYSIEAVMAEVEKCEVRCANCHRRITAQRGGFFGYIEDPAPAPSPQRGRKTDAEVCGTRNGYRRGCRCGRCKEAQRVYMSAWKRDRPMGKPPGS